MKNYILKLVFFVSVLTLSGFAHPNELFAQQTETPKNLTAGLNDLSDQIGKGLAENQKRRIAVVEFVDLKGNLTDLGRHISEELITKLFQSGKFTVVERQRLNQIISEQKLSLTGIIDPASAQKLGKLLGVDAIASGSVSDLTKTVKVNARLISTETGEVFSAASVEITKDDTVRSLMGVGTTVPTSSLPPDANSMPQNRAVDTNAIATKDLGSLRVVLKSVRRVKLPEGSGIQCSFEFANLDQKPIGVAMNGAPIYNGNKPRWLRSTLVDENSGLWVLSDASVIGMSIAGSGQRLTYPRNWYAATDIAMVLSITDDPNSDLASNGSYRLFYGSTTELSPGQSRMVTMTFLLNANQTTAAATFQLAAEIVVGVAKAGTKKTYTLHNLTMDRVSLPSRN